MEKTAARPASGLAPAAIALALCSAAAQANTPLLNEMIRARDLVCEMKPGAQAGGRSLMIFIEAMEIGKARMVSTGTAGSRPVKVYTGDTGVHLVEDVASSVRVTSVLSCLAWKRSIDPAKCVRYEAVNRWHFDTSVRRNPDQAFLKLGENSWAGWCEPWRLD